MAAVARRDDVVQMVAERLLVRAEVVDPLVDFEDQRREAGGREVDFLVRWHGPKKAGRVIFGSVGFGARGGECVLKEGTLGR